MPPILRPWRLDSRGSEAAVDTDVLMKAADEAVAYLRGLDDAVVAVRDGYPELLRRLAVPLSSAGEPPGEVVEALVRDTRGGLLASAGPRFFGWVIGGALPAAVATDWLVSAWDQNGALYQTGPAAAVLEEVAGEWLLDVLGLPAGSSFAFVTGCQMAHFTALAAARQRLLADRGIDVGRTGMHGAPPFRIVTGSHRHESLLRALRFLGIGTDALRTVDLDGEGRMDMGALEAELVRGDGPTVVCLMAGDLNTGAADPFREACALARGAGAWVHVDGAFGLWMAASERHRAALDGCEEADSWATDGHKWLNLPFDSGFAFVRDREAHRAAMSMTASYFLPPDGAGRDPMDWNPEWSRRSRGIVAYAALRSLGREGVAALVDHCCRLADRLVAGLGALPDAEVLAPARMNQGLVRFRGAGGDHDRRTDAVIEAVRAEGTAWFGGTDWKGVRAMRVSVCNHRTTDGDVDRTVDAVRRVLAETP